MTTFEAGDPVRVKGRRGLFRFVVAYETPSGPVADVVGPVGRAGEGLRTFPLDRIMRAPHRTPNDVAMSADVHKLSELAKSARRKP